MSDSPALEIDGERFSRLEEFFEETPPREFRNRHSGCVWRASQLSRERLGYSETVRQLERRLSKCHPNSRPVVQADLDAARHRQGPTVFEWLVEIVSGHTNVRLVLA